MQTLSRHRSALHHCSSTFLLGMLLTLSPWVLASGWQPLGNVSKVAVLSDGVELTAGSSKVRVVALSSNIVRVRYAPQGTFPADHSFALVPSDRKAPKVRVREEKDSIEEIIEPYLLQIGFLNRTPRGRMATRRAYEHFGLEALMRQTGEPTLFN